MAKYADEWYIKNDPFFGDEADLACRNVAIRIARKMYDCYGLNGAQDHKILPGERYRYETARVDGSFWGAYRICLDCMDRHINDFCGGDRAKMVAGQPKQSNLSVER